jgi:hypothetical protein
MPEIVHWLAAEPHRWLVPLTGLSCVVGIPLMLWREKRTAYHRRRQMEILGPWLGAPTEDQAVKDRAALGASESAARLVEAEAERILRNEAYRLTRRSNRPKPSTSSD